MIKYSVHAEFGGGSEHCGLVKVKIGDREYSFSGRHDDYLSCSINAAMFYAREHGYGMRVLDTRQIGAATVPKSRTYEITLAKAA